MVVCGFQINLGILNLNLSHLLNLPATTSLKSTHLSHEHSGCPFRIDLRFPYKPDQFLQD